MSTLDTINNSALKIFAIVIYIILFYLLVQYVNIRLSYKPIFDWWKNNNGSAYSAYFNLFTVVSSNYSTVWYYLSKLQGGPLNQLNIDQIRFMIAQIFPYMTYIDDQNVQQGLITPRSICQSVKLSSIDNDALFSEWLKTATKNTYPVTEGAPLVYHQNPGINGTYTYTLVPNIAPYENTFGVYPTTKDYPSWSALILEWLGPGWIMTSDADGILHPTSDPAMTNSLAVWFMNKGKGRGDNFLARMGILPDTPLVTYFCNNRNSVDGMVVDDIAFENLLEPIGSVAGGWVGFLNGSSHSNYDDYVRIIRSSTDFPVPISPTSCQQSNAVKGIASGATTFVGIAVMSFATPPFAPFIIAAALITGGLSGYEAGKGTC